MISWSEIKYFISLDWTSNRPASNLLPGTMEGYSRKEEEKKRKKKKGKVPSPGALNKRDTDTVESDAGADCGECYKKSSAPPSYWRLGGRGNTLGGVWAGSGGGGAGSRLSSRSGLSQKMLK